MNAGLLGLGLALAFFLLLLVPIPSWVTPQGRRARRSQREIFDRIARQLSPYAARCWSGETERSRLRIILRRIDPSDPQGKLEIVREQYSRRGSRWELQHTQQQGIYAHQEEARIAWRDTVRQAGRDGYQADCAPSGELIAELY